MAEQQNGHRKESLLLFARFAVVKGRSRSVAKSAYLNSVSNACEAATKSLSWTPGLSELQEEFPFIFIDKSTMAFLTGQNKDFGAVSQTNLTRVS